MGVYTQPQGRLVVKGFTQTYGLDYFETFPPFAKLNTIGVLYLLLEMKIDSYTS